MKLHELLQAYAPLLTRLLMESHGIEYRALFLEPDKSKLNPKNASELMNQWREVYLFGILERAHLACITSIARNIRWLKATNSAAEEKNVLAFSASLRGYLESCADAHDVMKYLPASLEKLSPYLYLVFAKAKEVDNIMVAPEELENRLIHYAYAKRQSKGTSPLPHHANKSNAEYIREFEAYGVPQAKDLYAELCELTHPAAASVSCFLDEENNTIRFNSNKDEYVIRDILSRYEDTINLITMFSLNPALSSLCFLHRISSDWPAPSDLEIQSIGTILSRLKAFDHFVEGYANGIFDRAAFLKSIQ